jgi:hypothetical protein
MMPRQRLSLFKKYANQHSKTNAATQMGSRVKTTIRNVLAGS